MKRWETILSFKIIGKKTMGESSTVGDSNL